MFKKQRLISHMQLLLWQYFSRICTHSSSFVVVRYWLILPVCSRVISWGQEHLNDCQCQWNILNMSEWYINGIVQDCSKSSALAMELLQSCTKPSICTEQSRTQSCAFCWDILYPMKSSMNLLLLLPWEWMRPQRAERYHWSWDVYQTGLNESYWQSLPYISPS